MTDTDDLATSGEQRLKIRRNSLLRYCALAFLVAALIGAATGMAGHWFAEGRIPAWLLLVGTAVVVAGFVWFSMDYYRRVDELDLLDNLWANTIALYSYFIILACWYFFHHAGMVREPEHIPIAIATIVILFAAYGLRKLRWH